MRPIALYLAVKKSSIEKSIFLFNSNKIALAITVFQDDICRQSQQIVKQFAQI